MWKIQTEIGFFEVNNVWFEHADGTYLYYRLMLDGVRGDLKLYTAEEKDRLLEFLGNNMDVSGLLKLEREKV